VPPFNFYSSGGNLASAPAGAGNVVLCRPARAVTLPAPWGRPRRPPAAGRPAERSPQLDIWPADGGGMHSMACPYYRRIRVEAHISTIHGYCEAEETWRLRVVTLQEETQYCTTEQHTACPVLRAREAWHRGEEDICAPVE
jgi:hypothetical protein